jgi:hypothetical protein
MPNYCSNDLFIQGNKQSISKLKEELFTTKDDEIELTFNNTIPMPKEYEQTDEWYDWRCDNWGTKWDAFDTYIINEEEEEEINVSFTTAWTPPLPFLYALANKYPDVTIECHFIEMGCEICGSFYSDEMGIREQEEEMVYVDDNGKLLTMENDGDECVYRYVESGEIYENEEDDFLFPHHPQLV